MGWWWQGRAKSALRAARGRARKIFQFADAPSVSPALERLCEERVKHFFRVVRGNEFLPEANHVRIVVLPRQFRHFHVETIRRADARNLVRRNRNPDARPAHEHAKICAFRGNILRHCMGKKRVIDGGLGDRPAIDYFVTSGTQKLGKFLFQLKARVIAPNAYFHGYENFVSQALFLQARK